MIYTPDAWVIVKITYKEDMIYKILAGWRGGFTDSDSWQLSSGIVRAEVIEPYATRYKQASGSLYICYASAYGFSRESTRMYDIWRSGAIDNDFTIALMPQDFEVPLND